MSLLTQRNYLPLFITQMLGVFNDNLFKSALTMLVTYKLAAGTGINPAVLVTLGGAIFIAPYVIFSGFAGQLADKFEKSNITRWVKVTEVLIMVAGTFVLVSGHLLGMFFLLFLMGTHSTFFSPIKYGILPQALHKSQLVAANALFEATTFLAILTGTMFGSYFALQNYTYISGPYLVGISGTIVALAGLAASLFIPKSPGVDPTLHFNKNFLWESLRIVGYAKKSPDIYRAIVAASWFWLLGAVILSIIPVYSAHILHGNEATTTFLLSLFSVGIAIGSILCQKIFGTKVNLAYVPLSAVLLSTFGFGLILFSKLLPTFPEGFQTLPALLSLPIVWPLIACFIGLAMMGGIFTVPLYAFIQATGEAAKKSRLIAANNVLNAIYMVAGALASSILFFLGASLLQVLGLLMFGNLFISLYTYNLMPHTSKQRTLQALARLAFGIKIVGAENLHNLPKRLLIISNHVSFLDAFLLAIFVPIRITFAIDVGISKKWWVKPCLSVVNAFPLDVTNPYAIRSLINLAKTDEPIMIFPEGRLTKTGTLMKVYDGTAMVAVNAETTILPIHLEGLQFSKVSRLKGIFPLRWFPRVTITVGAPVDLDIAPEIRGRARRIAAGQKLQHIMVENMFAATPINHTLFTSFLRARKNYGPKSVILTDPENNISFNKPLTYADVTARSLLLADIFSREDIIPPLASPTNLQAVGVLLPNATATAVTFFALQAAHAVPAMLNFTSGVENLLSACKIACVSTILTSHRFVEAGKYHDLIAKLEKAGLKIRYLEDLRAKVTTFDKLKLLLATRKPEWFYREYPGEPHTPAAVLFTSGSEGKPKGVALSHVNFNANVAQAHAVVDFTPQDTLLNALPMFHCFGLTGGTLLPMLYGVQVFLYPSPLHYRIVPEMAYQFNASIMFGTDTFLNGYARYAHGYDFYRMRYIFAGAEKVKPETRTTYMEKFGVRILEGYGATETTPVISLNTPLAYKKGSVGQIVPGMSYRLEPVPGIEEGGNLIVKGPNIMMGYLKADAPGHIQPPSVNGEEGWYELGDIVTMDDLGFITIQGRLKRFAKIGGEMVSLTAVEAMATACWPDAHNAVIALPDDRKGEQLILFTTQADATKDTLRKHSKEHGGSELALPRHLKVLAKIPTLATGKTDYVTLTELAKDLI